MADIIEKNTESSHGGICPGVLEIVASSSGIIFSDVVRNSYTAPINLLGREFEDLHCVRSTVQFSEEPVDKDGSVVYRSVIRAIVAKDSPERVHTLYEIERKQWLVKFKDQNGTTKLLGNLQGGASMIWSRDNKAQYVERNEMVIEFTIETATPTPAYPW